MPQVIKFHIQKREQPSLTDPTATMRFVTARGRGDNPSNCCQENRHETSVFIVPFFLVTLTLQKVDVKKAACLSQEEFFGYPPIGHQKAPSERKETGQKRGIKDQAQDFDQKGAASNRIEEFRYGFCSG
jgi:hypothetical protein